MALGGLYSGICISNILKVFVWVFKKRSYFIFLKIIFRKFLIFKIFNFLNFWKVISPIMQDGYHFGRFSNGYASRFQIPFYMHIIFKPTFQNPIENQPFKIPKTNPGDLREKLSKNPNDLRQQIQQQHLHQSQRQHPQQQHNTYANAAGKNHTPAPPPGTMGPSGAPSILYHIQTRPHDATDVDQPPSQRHGDCSK